MKYFTISEMLYSPTAVKRGIWNGCDREKEDNLEALVDNVLDPVRTRYGKAVHVSSGYRCEQLNTLIHGALGSQHLRGEAADIYTDAGPQGNLRSPPTSRHPPSGYSVNDSLISCGLYGPVTLF